MKSDTDDKEKANRDQRVKNYEMKKEEHLKNELKNFEKKLNFEVEKRITLESLIMERRRREANTILKWEIRLVIEQEEKMRTEIMLLEAIGKASLQKNQALDNAQLLRAKVRNLQREANNKKKQKVKGMGKGQVQQPYAAGQDQQI